MKFPLLVGLLLVSVSSFAGTFDGPGTLIQPAGPLGFSISTTDILITNTGLGVESINSVTLRGLTHPHAGNLEALLYNVNTGLSVSIFTPPDGTVANFDGDYIFTVNPSLPTVDEALMGKPTNYVLPSGSYAMSDYGGGEDPGPRTNFDAFKNIPLDGDWRLMFVNFGAGEQGSLASWSLNVNASPVPEPCSLLAVGAGVVGLLRRRKTQ